MPQVGRVQDMSRLMILMVCFLLAPQHTTLPPSNGKSNHAKSVRVVSIRFGQYGGTGEGYASALQVSDGKASLTETWGPASQSQRPSLRVRSDLSTKRWQKIQALVDREAMLALPDRISCGTCVDGVDEVVEVRFSDHTMKSVTYAYGGPPKELKDLVAKLRALEQKLEDELPPGWYKPR